MQNLRATTARIIEQVCHRTTEEVARQKKILGLIRPDFINASKQNEKPDAE